MKKVILTGDRPTGRLHVGHYVGSLKERVRLQNTGEYDEIFIMIADAQALTDNADNPEKVRQNILQVALDYLACGLDPNKVHIFIQSMVPQLTELSFYYQNLVTVSRLQRNPTVKSEIQMRNFEASIPVAVRIRQRRVHLHAEPVLCRKVQPRRRCGHGRRQRGHLRPASVHSLRRHQGVAPRDQQGAGQGRHRLLHPEQGHHDPHRRSQRQEGRRCSEAQVRPLLRSVLNSRTRPVPGPQPRNPAAFSNPETSS